MRIKLSICYKKRACLSIFLFEILTIEMCLLTYASPVMSWCRVQDPFLVNWCG